MTNHSFLPLCSQADYRYSEINDKLAGITHKLGDAKVRFTCMQYVFCDP